MKSETFASPVRRRIIHFIVIIVFGILTFQLFHVQVIEHETYDEKSAMNSIKAIERTPLRGVLYDRNGEILVNNIPAYTIRIIPAYYSRDLNKYLEAVLEVDSGYVDKILENHSIYSKYVPVRIKRGVDFKVIAWLEENSEYLSGVDYIVEMQRGYPADIDGSHMFGYTKEISPKQLEKNNDYYDPGDYIGHAGIEKGYEKLLRGEKGYKYILVNNQRKEIGRYKDGEEDVTPIKGKDLVLSIDADVQRVAEKEFEGKRGATVAIEPKTGEILAMVSSPDYNLNEFAYVTSQEYLQGLYSDTTRPLFNRATMSLKPPGSTYKVLDAITGLDLNVIDENTTFYCAGGGYFYGRFFKCHGVHGNINVVHAIEKSCNTFFYNLIFKIGMDKWAEYSRMFGFGKETGIDIGEEKPGLIPDSKYYEDIYGENWPKSIMASLSIGQGEVSVTPLQLAQYTALVANEGSTYKPHLVKGYLTSDNREFVPFEFEPINIDVSKRAFNLAKRGMFLVVNGYGTATWIRMKEIDIAGKTGTAQNPHGKDHALFIAFAPFENPQIAIAVVVENVGFGSTYAAPIAKKMIEAYLLKKDKEKKFKERVVPELKEKIIGASFEN